MDLELSFFKFKLIFINIFFILYKAATLNFSKLRFGLTEINYGLEYSNNYWLTYTLQILISVLLIAKFLFGYCTLTANVIALFPLLTDEQPELLLPTLVSQLFENVVLPLLELVIAYITFKYYLLDCLAGMAIFALRLVLKLVISLSILNSYTDFYTELRTAANAAVSAKKLKDSLVDEIFMASQTLN